MTVKSKRSTKRIQRNTKIREVQRLNILKMIGIFFTVAGPNKKISLTHPKIVLERKP
jgi:hypothetical protein